MNKRNGLIGFVLVVAIAIGGYWWWSPILVLHQMQRASVLGDADGINDHVDYPALRESFRGQLSALMGKQLGESKDNPFAAFGGMIALAFANQAIDAFVRPETIAAAMRTGRIKPAAPAASNSASTDSDDAGKLTWTSERKGLDRLIAYPHKQGEAVDPKTPAFVFVRHGFANWKLTEIRLPLDR